jgi:hypothetical protein
MGKALTVRTIATLKPKPARREIPDGLLAGLYLIVQPSGAKSWGVRYRIGGRPRKLTLGSYPGIDLSSARELARKALVAVAEGRDPALEKKNSHRDIARHERDLFEKVAAQFLERYAKANTRESTWHEAERLLNRDVVPRWKGRAVREISNRDVIELKWVQDEAREIRAGDGHARRHQPLHGNLDETGERRIGDAGFDDRSRDVGVLAPGGVHDARLCRNIVRRFGGRSNFSVR